MLFLLLPHAGAALGQRSGLIQQGKAAAQPPHGQGWVYGERIERAEKTSWLDNLCMAVAATKPDERPTSESRGTGLHRVLSSSLNDCCVCRATIHRRAIWNVLVELNVEMRLQGHRPQAAACGIGQGSQGRPHLWFRPVEAGDRRRSLPLRRRNMVSPCSRFSCSNRNPRAMLPEDLKRP
jgi:hypothetical protein